MDATEQIEKRIAELEEELRRWTNVQHKVAVAVESAAPAKRPVGRPAHYEAVEELQDAIGRYFDYADEQGWPYTVPDLAYYLGFNSRTSLLNYEGREEFMVTIKRAKLKIEGQRARQLVQSQGVVAGQIFDLKNDFGWRDQQEKIATGAMNTINIGLPGMPPAPRNIEEWEGWYRQMVEGKSAAAIDVAPA